MNEKMRDYGANRSVIREIFEYGSRRKSEIGNENVFDFSLGNPSVPAPEEVRNGIIELLKDTDPILLHGYTSAPGDMEVRRKIAEYLNSAYGADADANLIYLTAGAAASLTVTLTAILNPGEEVLVSAPYFPEYKVFTERTGAVLTAVASNPADLQPDIGKIGEAITEKTRAMILNSPNNPTGVIVSEENLCALCALLKKKSAEYGRPIYLISDEPYRELVYEGEKIPYLPGYYADTVVCYSFSKSLSMPGERIGYIQFSPRATEKEALWEGICGAGRALGYVCAPSLFQRLIPMCLGKTSDLSVYDTNRKLLRDGLTEAGFEIVPPEGAFYLFLRSPEPDAKKFCEKAREKELLLVPADDFGAPGFVRIAYCVSTEQVRRSMPAFFALAREYGLKRK